MSFGIWAHVRVSFLCLRIIFANGMFVWKQVKIWFWTTDLLIYRWNIAEYCFAKSRVLLNMKCCLLVIDIYSVISSYGILGQDQTGTIYMNLVDLILSIKVWKKLLTNICRFVKYLYIERPENMFVKHRLFQLSLLHIISSNSSKSMTLSPV